MDFMLEEQFTELLKLKILKAKKRNLYVDINRGGESFVKDSFQVYRVGKSGRVYLFCHPWRPMHIRNSRGYKLFWIKLTKKEFSNLNPKPKRIDGKRKRYMSIFDADPVPICSKQLSIEEVMSIIDDKTAMIMLMNLDIFTTNTSILER